MQARSAVSVPAKPSLGSSPTDGRPSIDGPVRHLTRTPTGAWQGRVVPAAPAGVPLARHWGEIDLTSGLYDAHGVCVPA